MYQQCVETPYEVCHLISTGLHEIHPTAEGYEKFAPTVSAELDWILNS